MGVDHRQLALALALLGTSGQVCASERLDSAVRPVRYDLALEPDLDHGTFSGRETIEIRLPDRRREIVLHALRLDVADVSASGLRASEVVVDPQNQLVRLRFPRELEPGTVKLQLAFSGRLGTDLRGLYLSESDGRRYAITQFEPTDARRAFPCFDEPAMKARFAVRAIVAAGHTAVSNGAIAAEHLRGAKKEIVFVETPPMSSYLVALAVGPFEKVEASAGKVPVRAFVPPGKSELARHAVDVAAALAERMGQYFGVPYPFGKLDLIAAPDFEAGAMENTGAIVFREARLLLDEKTASTEQRRAVVEILAHEMAHQWFGDLVTMAWWDDLWLNEAFATWATYRILDDWHPDWKEWLDFAGDQNQTLAGDSLAATHPIRQAVASAEEANEVFDGVTYSKGAAVIRMIERYVGEDVFRRGVSAYLKAHAYGNTTANDLWHAIAVESGKPIEALAATWVNEPGHPVISLACANRTWTFTSEPRPASPAGRRWLVPIQIGDTRQLLEGERGTFSAPCVAMDRVSRLGFYRLSWRAEQIPGAAAKLSAADQLAMLSDIWSQVTERTLEVSDYLTAVSDIRPAERAILDEVGTRFDRIEQHLLTAKTREPFHRFVRDWLGPLYAELGWDPRPGEDEETRLMRAEMLETLGQSSDDPEILREADRRLDRLLVDDRGVDGTIKGVLVRLGARHGGVARFEAYRDKMRHARTPEERVLYQRALTEFEDPLVVARALALLLSDEVRTQDRGRLLAAVFRNAAARLPAWRFLRGHYEEVRRKSPEYGLGRVVAATGLFCEADAAREVSAFFAAHPVPGTQRELLQSVESIQKCAAWRARNLAPLARFLRPGAERVHSKKP